MKMTNEELYEKIDKHWNLWDGNCNWKKIMALRVHMSYVWGEKIKSLVFWEWQYRLVQRKSARSEPLSIRLKQLAEDHKTGTRCLQAVSLCLMIMMNPIKVIMKLHTASWSQKHQARWLLLFQRYNSAVRQLNMKHLKHAAWSHCRCEDIASVSTTLSAQHHRYQHSPVTHI